MASHSLRFLFFFSCCLLALFPRLQAQTVKGTVLDETGLPLAYASVYVKGGKKGTTTNTDGKYTLDLVAGTYTIISAHIGYGKHERTVTLRAGETTLLDFTLFPAQVELKEVVVKAGAEDPAYVIMRNAIAKRKEHLSESRAAQSTVYMKGLIRTLRIPGRIMGRKIDLNQDLFDSSGKGIIYFSESVTRYTKGANGLTKEDVISAKVSGNSSGFGFNSPQDLDVNFYESNIMLQGMTQRGFISPLHENAFHYYRFKFQGSFYEDGREINKIAVIPKRKFEPVFAGGFINIFEKSWRIHSLQLSLNKASQIEIVDTLDIVQEMMEPEAGKWFPRYTRIMANFGILGIKASADFAAVHSDYSLVPVSNRFWETNIIKSIDTAANKKTADYWDALRPIPLTEEEQKDYVKKDSLEKKFNDPRYLDSIDRKANRFQPVGFVLSEQSFFSRAKKTRVTIPGLLRSVQYNTVEQWAFAFEPVIRSWRDTGSYTFSPRLRYNTGLQRFYADFTYGRRIGRDYKKRWDITIGAGRYMFQINPDNPIDPMTNTFATLLYSNNLMKVYEKAYGRIAVRKNIGRGLTLTARAAFEDRRPLENTDTTYRWKRYQDRRFTSNYPEELPEGNFNRHQALLTGITLQYQPGVKYIEYPNRLVAIGSNAPVFSLQLTKAWSGILGADERFGKWRLAVTDEVNMKLGGSLKYNISTGGFIQNSKVQLPDYQHFQGNQTIVASPYVRSFQLARYYAYSTADGLYATAHAEWHLNGLITNKIPLFKKANMGLVTGANTFYVDRNRHYAEVFVGLENILKVLRVDFTWGYDGNAQKWVSGVVLGFGSFLGSASND